MNISSFVLYFSIVLLTTVFASKSQKIRSDGSVRFIWSWFIMSFLIHWFFIAFTTTGADHESYINVILYKSDFFLEKGVEPGFNGMCVLLRERISNPEIIIFIFKTLTVCIYYLAFWLLRDKIHMTYLMMAYNAGLYLWSFVVIAQTMAVSIIILSAAMMIREAKNRWPLFLSIVAYSIHSSAIILVVVFIAIALINWTKIKIGNVQFFLLFVVVILLIINLQAIFKWAITGVLGMDQYSAYEDVVYVSSGFFNYVFYAFLFVVFVMPIMKISNVEYKQNRNLTIVFFIYGMISAFSGYYLGSTRLNYYTYVFFMILLPLYFFQVKTKSIPKDHSISWSFQNISWVFYLLFIGIVNLLDASNPGSPSEMANYSLFNPFF